MENSNQRDTGRIELTAPKTAAISQARIPSLDGLRAVSIFMVLFAHATNTVNFPAWLIHRPSAFLVGTLGVRVFFVISGFLITTLLLKELNKNGKISLGQFYRRRALRILPVYYFYILTVLVIFGVLGLAHMPASVYISSATFTTHFWSHWGSESWPLQHTWSLSIEEQFYLVWPAMLAFLGPRVGGRLWVPFLIIAAPVARCIFLNNPVVAQLFISHGDSIAVGCLLALLFTRREKETKHLLSIHPHIGRVFAVVFIYPEVFFNLPYYYICGHDLPFKSLFPAFVPTLQNLSIGYLIGSFVSVRTGASFHFLNFGFIQWIGRLSYSLYIWQQIALMPKDYNFAPGHGSWLMWLSSFPQNIIFLIGLACLSYYCLEKPFLSLRQHK